MHTYILFTYMHTYLHTYMHTKIHTCMHAYIQTHIHVCIHTYRQAYRHTNILTYRHTNIHTQLVFSCYSFMLSLSFLRLLLLRQNTMNEKQVEEKKKSESQDRNLNKAETWRKGLMQKPQSSAYWLVPCSCLSLLCCSTQDYQPRDSTIHETQPSPVNH